MLLLTHAALVLAFQAGSPTPRSPSLRPPPTRSAAPLRCCAAAAPAPLEEGTWAVSQHDEGSPLAYSSLRVAVAAASVCAEAAAEEPPHAPHARPPAASGLLSEMQCLVFIATLLAEQDAAFAAQEARLCAEMGIGDDEPSEPPPSQTLLRIAVAACSTPREHGGAATCTGA